MDTFLVTGTIEIFPMEKPWHYLRVPESHTEMLKPFSERGLVPITVTIDSISWNTSLMPYGDGTQFIPLPSGIRKTLGLRLGDRINVNYTLRAR